MTKKDNKHLAAIAALEKAGRGDLGDILVKALAKEEKRLELKLSGAEASSGKQETEGDDI